MAIDSTSSSRSVFTFEVTNYSVLDGMGIGEFISSSTFSAGGCDWNIRFYPDGNRTLDNGDYVSAYLILVRGTPGVSVTGTFSLLFGDSESELAAKPFTKTFESVGVTWGFHKLINKVYLRKRLNLNGGRFTMIRSVLWKLLHLTVGGRFTIKCVLTVKQVPHSEDAAAVIVVPQPKLHQDLTDMLKSGEGADVTFSVCGQVFPAHRCILAARSMVFKAELFGAMKEKDAQRIEIQDMDPAVFEALLHFIYTDSLPDDVDNIVAMQLMLVAADRYGVDRLRLLCEAKLCRDFDVETVASALALAEQHHCTQMRDACIGFIASRDVLGAVMETDGFKHLITSCPSIMKEILDKVAAVWNNK